MKLTRLLPFWSYLRLGAAAGLAIAAAITVWRVTRDGSAGWTALGFVGGAALFAGLLSLWLWRWVPKQARKAEPMPDDAKVSDRSSLRWTAIPLGLAVGIGAVGRAADDSVIVSGVMTGLVAGALVGFTVAVRRLARWQAEHGKELLQWRRGGMRNPRHYLRPI